MKFYSIIWIVCFGCSPLFSQITITNNDMPAAGDSVHVSYAANVGTVDHMLTGPNYLWDFSSLVPNLQREFRYLTPTALPFNFLSTISFLNPSPDSLPLIGNLPSNFTDYFKNGSSGFRRNGLSFDYTPLTTFSIPVIFTSSDYVFRFPLNYGDLDTSDGAYAINFPPLPYIGQTIHRESNVDGWGTLITPFGTFNTLRVVSYVSTIDTIALDSLTGFSIPRPLEIQYKWMAAGMKIPVLEIDAQFIANNEVISNVIYQDSLRVTLPQVGFNETIKSVFELSVYPNPATQTCFVNYHSSNRAPVSIMLLDLAGREVKNFGTGSTLPGTHIKELDLNGIAVGTYLIKVTSGTDSVFQLIMVN